MRLGLSSPLAHGSAEEWAKRHHKLGLGSVVFPVNYTDGDEKIEAYVKAAGKYDLRIAEVGVWKNTLAANPVEREAAIEYAIGQLKLADRIGADCCVNIVGTSGGPVWDGGYRSNFLPKTWDETVEMIRHIIDEAAPTQTVYSIEPMPWMVPTGPEEYLRLLKDVDRDRLGVHMDMINMINCPERYFFMEEFIDRCFDLLGDRICSCHIKDIHLPQELTFQLIETRLGAGEFAAKYYLDRIERTNPEMPVIIEHLNSDQEYLESLAFVKELLKG